MKKSKKIAMGLIFLGLAATGAYTIYTSSGSPEERELNSALESGKPVLLYFHSVGCVACIEQEEILDAIERAHAGKVIIVRADFVENQELFKEYAGIVSSFSGEIRMLSRLASAIMVTMSRTNTAYC